MIAHIYTYRRIFMNIFDVDFNAPSTSKTTDIPGGG